MPMTRQQKEQFVEDMKSTFDAAGMVIITHMKGLDAAETATLRKNMNAANVIFKVTKNRLTRLAVKESKYAMLESLFEGPTAIAASADPLTAAKLAVEFANQNDKLTIVGGAMGDKELDVDTVKQLATLPSLDELRGKLVGLLQAPAGQLARLIQEGPAQLARVIAAKGDQG